MKARRTGNTAASKRRAAIRREVWPDGSHWTGVKETGWFAAPRSLPLVLRVLETKKVKDGRSRLGAVYLELLSRHIDEGVIEMATPEEHAYAAGFWSTRAQRDWRDHMKVLVKHGFITAQARGNMEFGYVLLAHPTLVVAELNQRKKLPADWWVQYRTRQIELKEPTAEELKPVQSGE